MRATARRQQLAGAADRVEGGEEDAALLPTGMPQEAARFMQLGKPPALESDEAQISRQLSRRQPVPQFGSVSVSI